MKIINRYILVAFTGLLLIIISCQKDNHELGALIAPTNVAFTFEIVGADAENPNGDGSGLVNFAATANNAITFSYNFGDGKDIQVAPDGTTSHLFSITGVNLYNVTVSAVGTGGIISTKTEQIEVLSTFADDEAVEFLTGGSSKNWYWAAEQAGHIGLGPNKIVGTGNEHTFSYWFTSNPWHPDKLCMYDAEFVFTKTTNGMSFEQLAGDAYIPGTYANKIGVEGDVCHGEDVVPTLYGVKDVSFSSSESIATIDGEYRGTTMTFSDGGVMCWYVGTSTLEIIDVTESVLRVRIEEDGDNAWYCTYTNVKPEQK